MNQNDKVKKIKQLLIDFSYPFNEAFELLDELIEPECNFIEGDLVAAWDIPGEIVVGNYKGKKDERYLVSFSNNLDNAAFLCCQHAIVFQEYTGKPDIGEAKGLTLKLENGSTSSVCAEGMRHQEWDDRWRSNKIIAWAPWVDRSG